MNNKHHEQAKLNVHVINCRSLFFLHAIYCYVVYLVLMIILRLPCRYLHTVAKSRHRGYTSLMDGKSLPKFWQSVKHISADLPWCQEPKSDSRWIASGHVFFCHIWVNCAVKFECGNTQYKEFNIKTRQLSSPNKHCEISFIILRSEHSEPPQLEILDLRGVSPQ